MKKYDTALAQIEKMVKAGGDAAYYVVYSVQGYVRYNRKDYTGAKASFNDALDSVSEYWPAWVGLGLANYSLERKAEGKQALLRAAQIQPSLAKGAKILGNPKLFPYLSEEVQKDFLKLHRLTYPSKE